MSAIVFDLLRHNVYGIAKRVMERGEKMPVFKHDRWVLIVIEVISYYVHGHFHVTHVTSLQNFTHLDHSPHANKEAFKVNLPINTSYQVGT